MSAARGSGAGQALHLAGARLGIMGLAALAALLVARWLGPHEFGVYASGAAVVPLVLAVGYGGIDQLFFRDEVSREDLPGLLAHLAGTVLVLGWVVALVLPGLEDGARVVAAVIFLGMSAEICRAWWLLECHRDGRLDVRGRRELVIRLAATVALVAAVALAAHPVAPALGQAATSVLLLVIVSQRRRRDSGGTIPARVSPRQFWQVLRRGSAYTVTGAIFVLYLNLIGVLVATMSSAEEAGQFRIAFGFFQMAVAIPIALNNDGFRSQLYALRGDAQGTRALRRRFARVNAGAGVVALCGVVFCAGVVVPVLLGPAFHAAVVPGYLLAASLPFTFLASYVGNVLIAVGRTRSVIGAQVIGLLCVAGLAAVWVPRDGAVGAARTLLSAEVALAVMYGVLLVQHSRAARSRVSCPEVV